MNSQPISGDLSLRSVESAIQSFEVNGFKLQSVSIKGDNNMVVFSMQNVPPRARLVLKGKSAPSGTTLSWSGELRVSGSNVDVELYRGTSAFAEPNGDIVGQIQRVQRALALKVDASPGPRTWAAIEKVLQLPAAEPQKLANQRSEAVIATLLPEVRPFARALYFKAEERGINMSLISGTRTYAEQDALYAQGRNGKGKIVTNARGGYSNHNFGIAFDVGVFKGKVYLKQAADYVAVGVLGEEIGLEWGGRWKSFPDHSHFQLRPAWAAGMSEREMLARLRQDNPGGVSIPAMFLANMARSTKTVNASCGC